MSNIFNNDSDDIKILNAALKKHDEEEELKARIIEEYEREKALEEKEKIEEEVVEEPKERVKVVEVDDSLEAEKKAERGRKITKAINITLLATAVLLACGLSFMGIRKLYDRHKAKEANNVDNDTTIEIDVDEVNNDESKDKDNTNETISIGGSFVDNHNQELFISSKKDLEEVDKNNTINDENNKKEETKKSTTKTNTKTNTTTTTTTTTTNTNTNVIPNNSLTITYDPNTNQYVVDSGNGDQNISDPIYVDPYNPTPVDPTPVTPQPEPGEGDEEPIIEEKYEGYVLRKLNFAKDGFWYTPYFSGSEIKVDSVDMSMVGDGQLDPHNSNIYALSVSKDVSGWEYIRDNNKDDQYLDSISNLDAVINSLIAEQERFRREQDNNQVSPQQNDTLIEEFIYEESVEPVVLQLRSRKIGR